MTPAATIQNSGLQTLAERPDLGVDLSAHEPLNRHASLRVGGPASVWAEVGTAAGLKAVLSTAVSEDWPYYVVGLGSNVVFPDEGIDGVVIRLVGELAEWAIEETREVDGSQRAVVEVGAGAVNAHLVRGLLDAGWVGAEFLNLIPGTFGGAVALNAGTKEAELRSILREVDLMVRGSGDDDRFERRRLQPDALNLTYRHSELPDGAVVVGGRIEVRRGDTQAASERIQKDRERREETQPYRLASVGSTFANPEDGYAGALIDEAGLKGTRIGGARISEHHANFFINEDDASSEDVLRLMALARVRVRQQFGIELRPEVRFVGFDGWSRLEAYEREQC